MLSQICRRHATSHICYHRFPTAAMQKMLLLGQQSDITIPFEMAGTHHQMESHVSNDYIGTFFFRRRVLNRNGTKGIKYSAAFLSSRLFAARCDYCSIVLLYIGRKMDISGSTMVTTCILGFLHNCKCYETDVSYSRQCRCYCSYSMDQHLDVGIVCLLLWVGISFNMHYGKAKLN